MTDTAPFGEQLRAARLAAGLSLDDVALGFETEPFKVSAFARAEWLRTIEQGVAPIRAHDLDRLLDLIAVLAATLPLPARRSAAA